MFSMRDVITVLLHIPSLFEQILPYAKQAGYTPDFNALLQHITR